MQCSSVQCVCIYVLNCLHDDKSQNKNLSRFRTPDNLLNWIRNASKICFRSLWKQNSVCRQCGKFHRNVLAAKIPYSLYVSPFYIDFYTYKCKYIVSILMDILCRLLALSFIFPHFLFSTNNHSPIDIHILHQQTLFPETIFVDSQAFSMLLSTHTIIIFERF